MSEFHTTTGSSDGIVGTMTHPTSGTATREACRLSRTCPRRFQMTGTVTRRENQPPSRVIVVDQGVDSRQRLRYILYDALRVEIAARGDRAPTLTYIQSLGIDQGNGRHVESSVTHRYTVKLSVMIVSLVDQ
jgi:hypothetical protein